jgi:hypothetical protein
MTSEERTKLKQAKIDLFLLLQAIPEEEISETELDLMLTLGIDQDIQNELRSMF